MNGNNISVLKASRNRGEGVQGVDTPVGAMLEADDNRWGSRKMSMREAGKV